MTTPQFDDDDYREILALRDRLRLFLHWSEGRAKDVGLTPAQHQLLLAVRGHPAEGLPTIGELAEHLQIRHHSAVGLIDRAEAAGLVERMSDAEDGRIVRIRLRKPGQDALDELTAAHVTELRVLAESFASVHLPEND